MIPRQCDVHLNQPLVRSLLDYDPETGKLTWKPRPIGDFYDERACRVWNARMAGQQAGTFKTAQPQIRIEGRNYSMKAVIFIWMTGSAPREVIKPRSGDSRDLRWNSIRQDVDETEAA
ncbi:MAG: hypothetical protein AAFY29_03150 [Pseudomonadota bacterium]